MPLCYSDKVIFKSNKWVPRAEKVQELTGNLAVFLNIQKIPLPPVEDILTKLIKTLNLPGSLAQYWLSRIFVYAFLLLCMATLQNFYDGLWVLLYELSSQTTLLKS